MRQVVVFMLCVAAGAAGDTESSDADVTNLLQLINPLPDLASGARSHLLDSDFTSADDKWSTPALTVKAVKPATKAKIVVTERHLDSSQRTTVPTIHASLAEPAQLAHLSATKPKVRTSKALAVKATKKIASTAHAKKATKAKKAKKKSESQAESTEEVKQGVPQRKAKKASVSKEVLVKTSQAVQKHQASSKSSQESLQAASNRKVCRDLLQECRTDLKVDACLRYKGSCLAGTSKKPELVESQAVGQAEPDISPMADQSQGPATGDASQPEAAAEPVAESVEPTTHSKHSKRSADAMDAGISQSGVGGFGTDTEPEPVEVAASEDVPGSIAEEAEEAEAEAAESSEQDATQPVQSVSPTAGVLEPGAEEASVTDPVQSAPAIEVPEAEEGDATEQDAAEEVAAEAAEAEAGVADAAEAEAAEAPEQAATEPVQSVSPAAEVAEAAAGAAEVAEQDAAEAETAEAPEQDPTEPVQSVSPTAEAAEAPEQAATEPVQSVSPAVEEAEAPEQAATEPVQGVSPAAEAPEAEAEAAEAPEQDATEPKSEAGVETEPVDGNPATTATADRVLEPEVPVKADTLKSEVSDATEEAAAPILGSKSQAMPSISDLEPKSANAAWVFGQAASTLTNNQEVGLQSTTFGLTRVDALGTSAGSLTLAQRELENQHLASVKENLCALWHTMCGHVTTAEICIKYASVCQ